MKRLNIRRLVVLISLLLGIISLASAQPVTIVTDCGTENASGGGINFDEALAIGGRIEFDCVDASSIINITNPKSLINATRIDGYNTGNQIVLVNLQVSNAAILPIFKTTSQDSLELYNIELRSGSSDLANGGILAAGYLKMANVSVRNFGTGLLMTQGEIIILNSEFLNNRTAFAFQETNHHVFVTGTIFSDNLLAIGGNGGIPTVAIPEDRSFVIEGSAFSRNQEAVRYCQNCRFPLSTLTIANSLIVAGNEQAFPAVDGNGIVLLNTTVVANKGIGVKAYSDGNIILLNSIIADNGTNCEGIIIDGGGNLQFPSVSCGSSIRTVEPGLGVLLDPLIGSPALGAGNVSACAEAPVNGKDYFRKPRGSGRCSSGAVEGPIEQPILNPPIDEILERLR